MKILALLSISLLVLCVQGCASLDGPGAGVESSATSPTVPAAAPGSAAPVTSEVEAAANGGSSLPASAPYSESNAPNASQNVNPAPFLTASQPQGSAAGPVAAPVYSLTRNADGTMSGPDDLPPASTGWGTSVPTPTKPATGVKPKAKAKTAAPPK